MMTPITEAATMIATTTATVMATVTVRREDVVRDDAADGVRDAVGVGRPVPLAASGFGKRMDWIRMMTAPMTSRALNVLPSIVATTNRRIATPSLAASGLLVCGLGRFAALTTGLVVGRAAPAGCDGGMFGR